MKWEKCILLKIIDSVKLRGVNRVKIDDVNFIICRKIFINNKTGLQSDWDLFTTEDIIKYLNFHLLNWYYSLF